MISLLARLTWLLPFFITSCMVGPNFHSPKPPQPQSYTETRLPHQTVNSPHSGQAGRAQTFIVGDNIPAEWWHLFRSQKLNELIQVGINNSPNLNAAYAALKNAQEILNAQIGTLLFPSIDATGSAQRQKFSGTTFGNNTTVNIFNLYNASVNVSYTLDIFGGSRRQLEALRAQVDYQRFELIAAYLSLTANIATTAISMAAVDEQIAATRKLITAQENQLSILRQQFQLGAISQENVFTQQTLVEQTKASLPPLEKNRSQLHHALSVLLGILPDQPIPVLRLSEIYLPTKLPLSIPSHLVQQRPDVRAAEALLHAATAQIGVATANLFPQFNITGNYGWNALVPNQLFSSSTNVWSLTAQVTQPIFHAGALLAERRAAIDLRDQAGEQYRQVVLQAFQNVADTLKALEFDAKTLRAQQEAEQAAYRNLNISRQQYRLGGASYLSMLNAQQQYQSVILNRVQAQAARYNDSVALFQALGGGWWNLGRNHNES